MLSLEQNFDILNLSYSQICNSIWKRSVTKCINQNEEEALSKVHSHSEASLNSKYKWFFEEIQDSEVPYCDNLDTSKSKSLEKLEISNQIKEDENLMILSNDDHSIDAELSHEPSTNSESKMKPCARKSKPRKNLHIRSDVLNKGSLRIMRKAFRHLFCTIFVPKRKRSADSIISQFRVNLNKFMQLIITSNGQTQIDKSSPEYIVNRELIGRMVKSKLYASLSTKYKSSKSSEIQSFITLYDRCWINYSHEWFSELVSNDLFKLMIDLYNMIKEKGLLVQYNIDNETSRRYINNVKAIEAFCLST